MALFQLDPQSIADRMNSGNERPGVITLGASMLQGTVGFTVVSLAGFAPWPIIDRWFPWMGEAGLYITSTAVFTALSGLLLHKLILGPGSLSRFYKVFTLAFVAYVLVWVAFWVGLRNSTGEIAGLLGGTAAMGAILAAAFDARRVLLKVIGALFVLNTAGYLAGGWIEGKLVIEHRLLAIVLWGICYGAGFGAGLGMAFHFCQTRARALIKEGAKAES